MKASAGIMLIWRFARTEARRSRHECIEPEHFVEAMTRGESLTDDEMLKLVIPDAELRRGTAVELGLVQDVLASVGINTVALRRSLRARLGTENHHHAEGATAHRSPRCCKAFAHAGKLASDSGASLLTVPYLFLAILNDAGTHLPKAVEAIGGTGSNGALRLVVAAGHSLEFGVRHLQKALGEQIEVPIAKQIMVTKKAAAKALTVDVENGHLVFSQP